MFLQWRAGQLPGQTGILIVEAGGVTKPSMEGRTIARPDLPETLERQKNVYILQWRAGQLPGQTAAVDRRGQQRRRSFNGGPDNCPARPRESSRFRP